MSATATTPPSPNELARIRLRLFGLVAVLAFAGVGLLVLLAFNARDLGDGLDDLGALAVPAVAVAGAMLIAAMVPASLVAGAAGYAVGTAAGFPTALAAATAGGVLCAVIARSVGTAGARWALGRRLSRGISWCDERPLRTVSLSRLVPGMPFNATSYALGLTGITVRDVAIGTALGFAPRCFAYVALGGSLRDLDSPEAQAAIVVSLVLLLVVTIGPRLFIRRAAAPSPSLEDPHG